MGRKNIAKPQPFIDYLALKRYYEAKYGSNTLRTIQTDIEQAGTAAAVELYEQDTTVITQIGKTELTLVLSGDADNASTTDKEYTLVYLDADGVSHTSVGTGTATLNGTPVAFDPAVADFYCAVSFTASEADANVDVIAKVAAGATYATISKGTATAATQAQLHGVGTIYGRSHTNHADGVGKIQYIEYATPWGAIKFGQVTHAADSTTETRLFECTATTTNSLNDTLTATTTTVKDFYRMRRHWCSAAPTSNCHEYFLGVDETLDLDGSDGDLVGVIKEGAIYGIYTRHFCLADAETWVGKICGFVATTTYIKLAITYTPYDSSIENTVTLYLPQDAAFDFEPLFRCKPLTDISFTILGNGSQFCGRFNILEYYPDHT